MFARHATQARVGSIAKTCQRDVLILWCVPQIVGSCRQCYLHHCKHYFRDAYALCVSPGDFVVINGDFLHTYIFLLQELFRNAMKFLCDLESS